jgi:MarR family transcriptional regulator, organic hydroperoxide resistance regulator
VSTPAVTKTATVLGKAGLLVRRLDERDSRLVRLWLTDAGRALQEPVESARELVEHRLADALTPTEHRHLIAALAKIANAAAADSVQDP